MGAANDAGPLITKLITKVNGAYIRDGTIEVDRHAPHGLGYAAVLAGCGIGAIACVLVACMNRKVVSKVIQPPESPYHQVPSQWVYRPYETDNGNFTWLRE